jgi:orotidine-5'-phosphate decarboxylase
MTNINLSGHRRIVFALDVDDTVDARRLVTLLAGRVGVFKIGLELFVKAGPAIIETVRALSDAKIFLDLKLHDIPTTVRRTMRQIATLGVDFTTVHCSGGADMLAAAVAGGGRAVSVLGVTVLTSVKPESHSELNTLVLERAVIAHVAGCAGVICSAWEVATIKRRCGISFVGITPGIRPPDYRAGTDEDQGRIMTPGRAVAEGADFVVVGRPIRDAADPAAMADAIAADIAVALCELPAANQ